MATSDLNSDVEMSAANLSSSSPATFNHILASTAASSTMTQVPFATVNTNLFATTRSNSSSGSAVLSNHHYHHQLQSNKSSNARVQPYPYPANLVNTHPSTHATILIPTSSSSTANNVAQSDINMLMGKFQYQKLGLSYLDYKLLRARMNT